jgi:hypothetical protein
MFSEKTGPVSPERHALREREARQLAKRARMGHEQAQRAMVYPLPPGLSPEDLVSMQRAQAEIAAADKALFEVFCNLKYRFLIGIFSFLATAYIPLKFRVDQIVKESAMVGRQEGLDDKTEFFEGNTEKEKIAQLEQQRLASRVVVELTRSDEEIDVPRTRDELRERSLRLARTTPAALAVVDRDRERFIDSVHRGIADHGRALAAQGLVTQALRWQQCASTRLSKMDVFSVGHRPEAAVNYLLEIIENPRLENRAHAVTRLADEMEGHELFIEELSEVIDRRARLERHDRVRMLYLRELLGQALQQRERGIMQDARFESGPRAKDYALQLDHVHQAEASLQVSSVSDFALGK